MVGEPASTTQFLSVCDGNHKSSGNLDDLKRSMK